MLRDLQKVPGVYRAAIGNRSAAAMIPDPDTSPRDDTAAVLEVLGQERASQGPGARWLRILGVSAIIALALAGALVWSLRDGQQAPEYLTREARRGDLVVTISATGHLQPTNQVDVSSELSGIVASVEVDYNTRVQAGDVLARLDTDKLRAQVLQSEASLAAAQAKLQEAEATVLETAVKLQRCVRLVANKLCSEDEADTSRAANKRALAAKASAAAQVAEAGARLEVDRTNLEKAAIRSPINGIVLVRAVDPGQTVATSLQAPVLFELAEDLSQMELHVDVDEADVGQVAEGQAATFTVDAFPDRAFAAQITQVRFGAHEVDGVITYETVLSVDNKDLLLRPGMTATAEIVVKRLADALLVPNVALRFDPGKRANAPESRKGSLLSQIMPRPPQPRREQQAEKTATDRQRVWVLRDGVPVPTAVKTGASDGLWTAVSGGDIRAGTPLVVDIAKSER